ncbi:MAG: polyribonucleotide nucleotidyltransferase [Deltaproteobacteria bacterium]|nr:polyribonucleotide nucleotidyltransferase [Deltaproteobacteria bacterium]
MKKVVDVELAGRAFSIEVGRLAKQAGGSAFVRYGDTAVLVTATAAPTPRENVDFLPLTVDYQEKTFAAGKIPGGFFKREGRPSEKEILTSRLIDRPIRPLFPKGWNCETQIIATVLSADKDCDPDVIAMCGASAALTVSDVPFAGPIAGIRVGRVGGKFVLNPTAAQLETSDVNLIVAGSADAIVMVEGGAKIVPDAVMLDALFFAHEGLQPILALQEDLRRAVGKPKITPPAVVSNERVESRVREVGTPLLQAALSEPAKMERAAKFDAAKDQTVTALAAEFPDDDKTIKSAFSKLKYDAVRQRIVKNKKRLDGRDLRTVRPITSEVGVLPRTHGSALFTRGETQALVTTTLGTSSDKQRIDALLGETTKTFMLHYNFPPFSVGEVKFLRGPSRRDIGHGALAERALQPVLPDFESFPYVLRIVSEILESNGSSSMATVCGGSLSLLDAGVKTKAPVAGIAMGLIKEGDSFAVLSDILGDEDHLGDMDFKVAGTAEGVTALQMDIKIAGVDREVMKTALEQAKEGRLHILGEMAKCIGEARGTMSPYAPRITTIKIRKDKIRDLIGPGGKVIRGLVEETGCTIDVSDDGTVQVASSDGEAMKKALDRISAITAEAEVGRIYNGKVRKIVDFGAFVEIMPGTDGLLHISQISHERIRNVTDVLKEGDEVRVKVLDVDRSGKIRLSRREAMEEERAE